MPSSKIFSDSSSGRLPVSSRPTICSSRARQSSNLRSVILLPRIGHARVEAPAVQEHANGLADTHLSRALHDLARRGARQAVATAEHRQRRQRIESADGGPEAVARAVAPTGERRDQSRLEIRQSMPVTGYARDRIGGAQGPDRQRDTMACATELAAHLTAKAGRQLVHPPLEVAQRPGGDALEPRAELAEAVDHRLLLAHDQLGRRGRRRRAKVGDEIGDREVHFVAHGRHDGHLRRRDRPGDDFFVEGPEILERAAAAADDDDVDAAERVEVAEPLGDLLGRAFSLHPARRDHDVELAEAPADHAEDVPERGAAGRGHDADLPRKSRQLALAGLVEEPFRLQARLQLLERELQRAQPFGLEQLDDQLVFAALGVDLDAAEGHHVQAVGRLELDAVATIAKQDDPNLRVRVLQGEVRVPRAVQAVVRDLALDPHGREAILEHLLQASRQLGDREHRARRAHATPSWRSVARKVLRRSIAIVIGPTPPGTGVIARARAATLSNSTSPTSLPVSRRLIPTSITQAPSFTMSPVTVRGRPAATQRTSARRVCAARSRVRVWHMVTVAWRASRSWASGLPTRRERPITTASAPLRSY